ncbi:MFS transporter [Bacillus inaquosorum]|uniref:MFS transporter n=1 Tax=Bacillus inaquosorum TaxID=483913 RepID=UPI003D035B43
MEKSILKNISFLNYLAISFFIRGGDAIFKIALILYIINMGGTTGTVGALLILIVLPAVLFGPLTGIFSDRYNQKVIIHLANISRIIMLALIPLVSNINILYIVGFLMSVATLFSVPSQKTILPLIVKVEYISQGAGYLASTKSIIDTLIPIFGSGLALIIGFTQTFYINASFYLIASVLLIFLKFNSKKLINHNQKNVFIEAIDGFKYLFSNESLKLITIASIFTLGLSGGLDILIPIYILVDMQLSETLYGLLIGILGAGIAIGGIIIPKLKSRFHLSILVIFGFSIMLEGGNYLVFSLVPYSIILNMVVMFVSGLSSAGFLIMVDSYMQTKVQKEYLGRTYSSYFSISNIFSVLVMGIVSISTDNIGISKVFLLCSLGILMTGIYTVYLSFVRFKKTNPDVKELKM